MIEVDEILEGEIIVDQVICGELNNAIEYLNPVTQEKTATPLITSQEVTYDNGYTGLSKVTIDGVTSGIDANIISSNIKDGVSILGVTGSLEYGYGLAVEGATLKFTLGGAVLGDELVL